MKKFLLLVSMVATTESFAQTMSTGIRTINNGKIGIGTLSPISDIDLVGDTIGIRNVLAHDNLWMTVGETAASINASGANSGLTFRVGSNATGIYGNGQTLSNVMTLMPNGNVGINKASPTQKLEVAGNVKATLFMGNGDSLNNVVRVFGAQTIGGAKIFTSSIRAPLFVGGGDSLSNVVKTFSDQSIDGLKTFTSHVTAPNFSGSGLGLSDVVHSTHDQTQTIDGLKTFTSHVTAPNFSGSGLGLSDVVHSTHDQIQTIDGLKTFTSHVTAPNFAGSGQGLFDVVHRTQNLTESIDGLKTFTSRITAPNFVGNGDSLRNVVHTADSQAIGGSKTFIKPVRVVAVTTAETGDTTNMIAAAYGLVISGAASLKTSSANCSLNHQATGVNVITFTRKNLSGTNMGTQPVVLSISGAEPGFITWTGTTGKIIVRTFNANGIAADRGFSFAVYKP